ncbi:hypothetical protein [Stenotrophomonas maltophilia]|uniref:hypothetical protein n=1 Tax=Stenotrophomonas maltophilia TaxID=40324 RepID=UPI001F53753A|nr:hypothetical protein [Stenotrophomonas maltophilia]MCI1124774.1 hypothetical protein [Stenotrophomonas maltophilia]
MSTDKTLADVQPGGRVRLGEQALSTSEGARRYVADFFATEMRRHDFGDYILTELAADFACALAQHLSAQPSPGGQGDTRIPFETWAKDGGFDVSKFKGIYNSLETRAAWGAWLYWQRLSAQPSRGGQDLLVEAAEFARSVLAEIYATYQIKIGPFASQAQLANVKLRAALAARQPVYVQGSDELRARTEGERAAYMEGLEEGKKIAARQAVGKIDEAAVLRRAAAVLDMWEGDSNQTGYMGDFKDAQAILEVLAQNAAQSAQAVDLGEVREAVRKAWQKCAAGESVDLQFGTLLALIDSMAVGK